MSSTQRSFSQPVPASLDEGSRILLVKHSTGWNVDRVSAWMEKHGVDADWCYPADGELFPDPSLYTGVISFGGAVSANDDRDQAWIARELQFIESCMKHELRFFGICLGAQLLARVMGARITPHPKDIREVGFCRVDPTPQSGAFLTEPLIVMQWHSEGFDIPSGATHTACGDTFPNQAYHLSEHVFGVQFHPEVNPATLAIWHERNKTRPKNVLTEEQRQIQMRDAHRHDQSITRWLDGVLLRWTEDPLRAKAD